MLGKNYKAKDGSGLADSKGFISLLILLVMVFLSWAGYEVLSKASSQERIVRLEEQRIKALYLADSGLEWANAQLTEDPGWNGGQKQFREGKVKVEVQRNPQGFTVITKADSGKAVQKRYGFFSEQENGILVLKSYGELHE